MKKHELVSTIVNDIVTNFTEITGKNIADAFDSDGNFDSRLIDYGYVKIRKWVLDKYDVDIIAYRNEDILDRLLDELINQYDLNENTSSKIKKITEELNSLTIDELKYVIKSLREAPIVDKFEGKNLDELYNSIIEGVREFLASRPENFTFKDTGNRWLINMENIELPIDITKLDTYQYIAVGSHIATSIEKAIELIKKHFNLE